MHAMSETKDPMIAALLREREGYVQFGKTVRVAAVDAELKRRGHKTDDAPKKRASRESKQVTAEASEAEKA